MTDRETMAGTWVDGRPIYLPVKDIDAKFILDLGCFNGTTTKAYAHTFPKSKVVGVDLDLDNCYLAKQNTQNISNIEIINSAVWIYSGEISCILWGEETNHIVGVHPNAPSTCPVITVNCTTIDELTKEVEKIDFIKMDIEGAEHEILQAGGDWVDKTQNIFVEIHDVTNDNIRKYLNNLGFDIVQEGFELIWGSK